MERFWKILANIVIWGALITYIVLASRQCSSEIRAVTVTETIVTVENFHIGGGITPDRVREILRQAGIDPSGIPVGEVNTTRISEALLREGFISDASAYKDLDGKVYVRVRQREPIARLMVSDSMDFYLTDDHWFIPAGTAAAEYLPVITGTLRLPFGTKYAGAVSDAFDGTEKKYLKNKAFVLKLINFVKLVTDNPEWDSQIVQICIRDESDSEWKEPRVELVPRVGNHIVVFGSLDQAQEKLDKLMLFYRNVLAYEGWDKYSYINIEYKDQVVCRNNLQ